MNTTFTSVFVFKWPDYLVMAIVLAISASIGIFFGWSDRKKSTEDYLLAGRKLRWWPVGVSILVTFQSAILIIGVPAEIYTYGISYLLFHIGMALSVVIAATVFVPLLFPLKLTSVYEYLERRFKSKVARVVGFIIGTLNMCLYSGVTIFGPAIAIEAVTGFPAWLAILLIGCIATFYTTLGGIKAVIWSDMFQFVIMTSGLLAILIKGIMIQGGISSVWKTCQEGGRIDFGGFSPDPRERHTVLSLIIGGTFTWLANIGVNQANVQRFSSVTDLRSAKLAVWASLPGFVIYGTLASLVGLIVYAYFSTVQCDPLAAQIVKNPNQLVPLFVMDVLGFLPGFSGMFASSLLCASLSTVSSNINSLSAMLWEDIFKPRSNVDEKTQPKIVKGFGLLFGILIVLVAFMALQLGGPATQIALSFFGVSGGPLLGMFVLGAFFPWANWIGVSIGGITSLAFGLWVAIGKYTLPKSPTLPPAPTNGCDVYMYGSNLTVNGNGHYHYDISANGNYSYNITSNGQYNYVNSSSVTTESYEEIVMNNSTESSSPLEGLYSISYLWYSSIGLLWVIILGLIISFITGATDPEDVDPELTVPFLAKLCCKKTAQYYQVNGSTTPLPFKSDPQIKINLHAHPADNCSGDNLHKHSGVNLHKRNGDAPKVGNPTGNNVPDGAVPLCDFSNGERIVIRNRNEENM